MRGESFICSLGVPHLCCFWHGTSWMRQSEEERELVKCLSLHWRSCQQHPSTSIYCLPLQFGLVYHIGINFIPMVNTAKKSALFKEKWFKRLGLIQILPACKQVIYKRALSKYKTNCSTKGKKNAARIFLKEEGKTAQSHFNQDKTLHSKPSSLGTVLIIWKQRKE